MPHNTDLTKAKVISRLMSEEDPGIDSIWLPADGRLQTKGLELGALCNRLAAHLRECFRGLEHHDFPMHYCAWGKARVGSTALNNLFGMTGFPSYYQPVKSILRTVFAGETPLHWALPDISRHPYFFSKETQGPYTLGECLFIPLQILIEAGYPPDRLHLIILERDPARSLASWFHRFAPLQTPERLLSHYIISALNLNRVRSYARCHGVQVTHYVYETSKEPLVAGRALFRRLGLARTFAEDAVTSWGDCGQLDSAASHRIIYPPQPAIYNLPGLHGSDNAYHYRNGGGSISDEHRRLLEECGVNQVYRQAVAACIRDLDLEADVAARLFDEAKPLIQAATLSGIPAG